MARMNLSKNIRNYKYRKQKIRNQRAKSQLMSLFVLWAVFASLYGLSDIVFCKVCK